MTSGQETEQALAYRPTCNPGAPSVAPIELLRAAGENAVSRSQSPILSNEDRISRANIYAEMAIAVLCAAAVINVQSIFRSTLTSHRPTSTEKL